MLNRSSGFGVGNTVNPQTKVSDLRKGLWVWGRPLPGKSTDGQDVSLLVVDSEGLGALNQDDNHDSRIFSLALLTCSTFVYNSVGSIDENALNNLNLVVNLTKHIQLRSSGVMEFTDPSELSKYFPAFMWIV